MNFQIECRFYKKSFWDKNCATSPEIESVVDMCASQFTPNIIKAIFSFRFLRTSLLKNPFERKYGLSMQVQPKKFTV